MPRTKLPQWVFLRSVWIGAGIFLLALVLRIWGIGWGLPNDLHDQSYHPDEPIVWIYSQQIKPAEGKFDPGFYNYPTLYLTTLRVATDLVKAYSGKGEAKTEHELWMQIGAFHLAGRVLSALAGSLLALAVFGILLRFAHPVGATCGGVLMAVAPGLVVHSKFQTVDIPAACFLALSAWALLRLIRVEGQDDPWLDAKLVKRCLIASAVFAGLAAGTKYTGILALASIWTVLAIYKPASWLRWGAACTAIGLGVFVVTTPGAVLNSSKFLEDFVFEMKHTSSGHGLVFAGTPSGFIYHIGNLFAGFGVLVSVIGVCGLIAAAWRKHVWAIALLAFCVPYYLLIGRAEVKFLRYTFPLAIGLGVGFGWAIGEAHRKGGWKTVIVGLGIVGLGGADGGGLRSAVNYCGAMAGTDPRDAMAMNAKAESAKSTYGVASDPWFYTPPLYPQTGLPRSVPFELRDQIRREATAPRVLQFVPEAPPGGKLGDGRVEFDVRLLEELKPDRVVISSFESDDMFRLETVKGLPSDIQSQVDRFVAFRTLLEKEYEPAHQWGTPITAVHDLMYVRPVVYEWKRKTNLTPKSSGS